MVNSRLKGGEDKMEVTTRQVNEQTSRKLLPFSMTGRVVIEKRIKAPAQIAKRKFTRQSWHHDN